MAMTNYKRETWLAPAASLHATLLPPNTQNSTDTKHELGGLGNPGPPYQSEREVKPGLESAIRPCHRSIRRVSAPPPSTQDKHCSSRRHVHQPTPRSTQRPLGKTWRMPKALPSGISLAAPVPRHKPRAARPVSPASQSQKLPIGQSALAQRPFSSSL